MQILTLSLAASAALAGLAFGAPLPLCDPGIAHHHYICPATSKRETETAANVWAKRNAEAEAEADQANVWARAKQIDSTNASTAGEHVEAFNVWAKRDAEATTEKANVWARAEQDDSTNTSTTGEHVEAFDVWAKRDAAAATTNVWAKHNLTEHTANVWAQRNLTEHIASVWAKRNTSAPVEVQQANMWARSTALAGSTGTIELLARHGDTEKDEVVANEDSIAAPAMNQSDTHTPCWREGTC